LVATTEHVAAALAVTVDPEMEHPLPVTVVTANERSPVPDPPDEVNVTDVPTVAVRVALVMMRVSCESVACASVTPMLAVKPKARTAAMTMRAFRLMNTCPVDDLDMTPPSYRPASSAYEADSCRNHMPQA
jgi:uncharacterized protein (DUF1786 family)